MAASKLPALAILLLVMGFLQSATAVRHTVKWDFATSATQYDDWAANQTFTIGDEIEFKYNFPGHNVFEVTKADLEACNGDNPIAKYLESNAVVPLNKSGDVHFICEVQGHCGIGFMKVSVKVVPASTTAPPPSTPDIPSPPANVPRPVLGPAVAPAPTGDSTHLQTGPALVVAALMSTGFALLI